MVDIVTRVNNVVNGFVWGPFGLALLLCTGLWLSVRTGFFQFRRMGYWLKHTIGAIFTNKDVTAHTSKEDMAISQFQSMCPALASRPLQPGLSLRPARPRSSPGGERTARQSQRDAAPPRPS